MTGLRSVLAGIALASLGMIVAACGPKSNESDENAPGDNHNFNEPGPNEPGDPSLRLARNCAPEHTAACVNLAAEITKARAASEAAIGAQDYATAMAEILTVEHKTDMIDLYRNSNTPSESFAALETRYKALAAMLQETAVDPKAFAPEQCQPVAHKRCQSLRRGLEQKAAQRTSLAKNATRSAQAVRLNMYINFARQQFPLLATEAGAKSPEGLALSGRYELLSDILERMQARGDHPGNGNGLAACLPELEEACFALEDELVTLRRTLDEALSSGDGASVRTLSWQINSKMELLDTLRQGSGPDSERYQAVVRKFNTLRTMWDPGSPVPGLKPYTEREQQTVKRVFQDFGPLTIKVSPIKLGADGKPVLRANGVPQRVNTIVEATGPMPWSGFWYRTRTNLVSVQPQSPLATMLTKFDQLSRARGEPVETLKWEIDYERSMNLSANELPEWEGLCDAWAMASMLRPEPVKALQLNGIRFSVGELKGLLTKLYQNADSRYAMATTYGVRYDGNAATDGELQDPRPEAFHRIVEVMLGERKTPFGVDSDPGLEVWNKPLYRMSWSVEPDPQIKDAFVVTAYPRFVRQINQVSNVPTAELAFETEIVEAPTFSYRLYVDPVSNDDGSNTVIYGEWLDDARDIHPDSIFIPDRTKEPRPANKELGRGRKVLDALFTLGVPVN